IASGTPQIISAAPQGLRTTGGEFPGVLRLNWNPLKAATSYEIWRNTSDDFTTATMIGEAEHPLYFDTSMTANFAHYFWVRAKNHYGVGPYSDSVQAASIPAVSPQITIHPASITVVRNSSASFVAAASGSPSPQFQWQ